MGKLSLGEGKITEVTQPGRSGLHHLITQLICVIWPKSEVLGPAGNLLEMQILSPPPPHDNSG